MNEYKFSDLQIGEEASFDVQITDEMMHQFLSVSGDSNPLHQDPAYAHERGFKDRVVYGFLTSALYSTLIGVHLPGKHALLQSVKKINFLKPVYIGDHLTIKGKVTQICEAVKVVEVKAWISNQEKIIVSDAILSAGLFV